MGVTTTLINKPFNPRAQDASPLAYNRAALYSGKALDFDGVNDNIDLDGFTMAGNVATIVFQAKFENDQYLLDIDTQRFVIRNTSSEGFRVFNSDSFTEYGETKRSELGFYSIVSDGTTQRAYYNGVQLGSDKTIIALDWSSATKVKIASNNTGTNNFFDGQLSGFKIFNTALTAAQIADLYNFPEKIVPTGVDNTALKLWLPMMEGAGTTAYDGSGNGNHGTISGATYVNGVGAPVAQTSVIDWNKGTNKAVYSEEFDNAAYLQSGAYSVSANAITSPDGKTTAEQIIIPNTQGFYKQHVSVIASTNYIFTFYAKKGTASNVKHNVYDNTNFANITAVTSYISQTSTTEWSRIEVPFTTPSGCTNVGVYIDRDSAGNGTMFYWGLQVEQASTAGPYVPTLSTTQPTPVLLPAGLTTGRDITGVNLFENVRKQGALNLDGQSWAEVHDNASLDFGTGSFTLEAWAKAEFLAQGSSANIILSLGGDITSSNNSGLTTTSSAYGFWIGGVNVSTPAYVSESWNHIVGVRSGSSVIFYFNGAQVATGSSSSSITNEQVKQIGRDNSALRYYPNQIAQPRIYNRALSAEEVQRNYNAGKNIYS